MNTGFIEIQDLRKIYRSRGIETLALNGVNLDVRKGEFVSVMGPSGSGKTTLLNMLATIDTPTSGKLLFEGKELHSLKSKELALFRRDHIGFLFQDYNLLEHLTIFDNIALPMTFISMDHKVLTKRIHEMADFFGILDQLKKYPYELSGGQKQRVAAARAIIKNPSIILADEPTGALDSKASLDLLNQLSKLNKTLKITILMVTHDPLSASYSERVVFLKDGKEHSMLYKEEGRAKFYNQILDQLSYLGGGNDEHL